MVIGNELRDVIQMSDSCTRILAYSDVKNGSTC
jgi:hypothetical protein